MKGRRDFLRGLVALPLVGGGVSLIGNPTAAAEPITPDLLEAYKTWLDSELRHLCWEMADMPVFIDRYRDFPGDMTKRYDRSKAIGSMLSFIGDAGQIHFGRYCAEASARAAIVLSAVGCDWRESGRSRQERP